jgi:hypothetical protein
LESNLESNSILILISLVLSLPVFNILQGKYAFKILPLIYNNDIIQFTTTILLTILNTSNDISPSSSDESGCLSNSFPSVPAVALAA